MITHDTPPLFIEPTWPAPTCVRAYTTLRQSGIGSPQTAMNAATGRAFNLDQTLLTQVLALPAEPIWIKQVHGTHAIKAIPAHRGLEADATFTDELNQVCAILTADCLPILVCDRQGKHVAAIHAGWRGLVQGIMESTLAQLQLPPEDTLVWLGPAIGPTQFEVQNDVYDAFTLTDPAMRIGFHPTSATHWLADLYTLARLRLQKQGIKNVYGGEYCTYSDQERFFSYRRDHKNTGRIVTLIWIADSC